MPESLARARGGTREKSHSNGLPYLFPASHNEKRRTARRTIDTGRTRHLSSNDRNSPRCVDSMCDAAARGLGMAAPTPSADTYEKRANVLPRYRRSQSPCLSRSLCCALYLDNRDLLTFLPRDGNPFARPIAFGNY